MAVTAIFTITAQFRTKRMITPSVVRTVWKQRYTPQIQESGHHFIYLENYVIQRQMNNQGSMQNKLKRSGEKNRLKNFTSKEQVNTAKQKPFD
jgi:hypothetical protein